MLQKFLLSKSGTGKFRFVEVFCDEEWHEPQHGYIIQRSYGQVKGKTTLSPEIIVDKTKQKRNWKEQYTLQFNSEVKKFLDKGYIEIEKHPNEYTEKELQEFYGDLKTNQYGVIKPMLAKQADKVTNPKIFDKEWIASRKLDGVRALFYCKNNKIYTSSRGGEDYNASTIHLCTYQPLVDFFNDYPHIVLDGELFKRFKSLQQISGAARMEKNAYDCEWLEYWIYDFFDMEHPELTADERQKFLKEVFHEKYGFPIYDSTVWDESNYPIYLLGQEYVSSWNNIEKLHDQFVSEGFEGVVIRDPKKPYTPGGRNNSMIKVKKYKDSEFLVVGYKLGLRGSEDMTFTCQLEDGRTFEAMPVGTREEKAEYVKNFETKYKGHKVECTYFNLSEDGIPTQPKARIFRFDLE